jgi:hypothetical protein
VLQQKQNFCPCRPLEALLRNKFSEKNHVSRLKTAFPDCCDEGGGRDWEERAGAPPQDSDKLDKHVSRRPYHPTSQLYVLFWISSA